MDGQRTCGRAVPADCVCNHVRMAISVTHFTDPGCPWAYSASPALAVLALALRRPARLATGDDRPHRAGRAVPAPRLLARPRAPRGYMTFRRRWGMPFATEPRGRVTATARACRAIVATRLRHPDREYAVFRALQFGWMTTPLVMDEEEDILRAIAGVPGIDAREIVGALDDPEVDAAYEADRADARTAEGSPTHFQGKAAQTDGLVRYTAPSLIFTLRRPAPRGGRLPADRGLRRDRRQPRPDARPRRPAPEDPRRGGRGVPGRPGHGRGRGDHDARQRRARHRGRRGRRSSSPSPRGASAAPTLGSSALWQPASAPVMALPSAAAAVGA